MLNDHRVRSGAALSKSDVIASCLVNSRVFTLREDARCAVRSVFEDCWPDVDFRTWDTTLDGGVAQRIVKAVGVASRINVEYFIWDLWDEGPTRPPRPAGH